MNGGLRVYRVRSSLALAWVLTVLSPDSVAQTAGDEAFKKFRETFCRENFAYCEAEFRFVEPDPEDPKATISRYFRLKQSGDRYILTWDNRQKDGNWSNTFSWDGTVFVRYGTKEGQSFAPNQRNGVIVNDAPEPNQAKLYLETSLGAVDRDGNVWSAQVLAFDVNEKVLSLGQDEIERMRIHFKDPASGQYSKIEYMDAIGALAYVRTVDEWTTMDGYPVPARGKVLMADGSLKCSFEIEKLALNAQTLDTDFIADIPNRPEIQLFDYRRKFAQDLATLDPKLIASKAYLKALDVAFEQQSAADVSEGLEDGLVHETTGLRTTPTPTDLPAQASVTTSKRMAQRDLELALHRATMLRNLWLGIVVALATLVAALSIAWAWRHRRRSHPAIYYKDRTVSKDV